MKTYSIRVVKTKDSYTHFFYKNIVHKNIEAQILDIKQWVYCLEQ